MGVKLGKSSYPSGHGPDDFECFGPAATKDGEFNSVMIADLGYFSQTEKDSNKYYHASVAKSKKTGKWYAYFEWGRTGASSVSFQMVECVSQADAQEEFADQCHSKNDKRGMWTTVAGIRTLTAKPGKDCYLVRPMAQRSVGLPDGRKITTNDGAKPKATPAAPVKTATAKPSGPKCDSQTAALMRDLSVATVQYTRSSMAGNSLPTQSAIDEGRQLLTEARKRLVKVGNSLSAQVNDPELMQITNVLYSRIPKIKPVGAAQSTWVLSQDNILMWNNDLDAFESALSSTGTNEEIAHDPFGGIPLTYMEWIDPNSDLGRFIYGWWPKATRNRHGGVGAMQIKNAWRFERTGDFAKLRRAQERIAALKPRIDERPLHQPERNDLTSSDVKLWKDSNTALMFHGTRSVNVKGILTKSLLLPKQLVGVMITGAMFGGGLYWADDWKKSDGYTSRSGSYWSSGGGGISRRGAFMFAGDVACGKPHVAPGPHGYTCPPAGTHCVFGKAGYSQVQNNEWIIFDGDQNALKYLVEYDCR